MASPPRAVPLRSSARIVIIGAGAAGTALTNRLRLEGAESTLIDPRRAHLYQPGLTLVATGLRPPEHVMSEIAHWLAGAVTWLPERVAAVELLARTVSTEAGSTLAYYWLVVAPGLILGHDAIEGFSLDLVGQNGIGALYAAPQSTLFGGAHRGREGPHAVRGSLGPGACETEATAVAFPRQSFDDLIARSPVFREFVFTAYSWRITDLFTLIDDIVFQRMDVRLALRLLELADSEDIVRATHAVLGTELGTAREVVSRSLSEFQRRGWVEQARGELRLFGREGLEHLVKSTGVHG